MASSFRRRFYGLKYRLFRRERRPNDGRRGLIALQIDALPYTELRRAITCNTPAGVQYIRDRIHSPGALAGGSSYVNLLDGDAQTVALTVATREKMSVYRRLGGTRMALLMVLHPIRMVRM